MKANPSNPALSPQIAKYKKQSRNPVIPTGHIGIIQIVILQISPIFLRIWRTEGTAPQPAGAVPVAQEKVGDFHICVYIFLLNL